MSILRDIFRRKGRSILTITGIGIGVFALVVLGAVAENMNVYVGKLVGYYDEVIVVVESKDANFVGMSLGTRPLSMDTVDKLRAYPGVAEVSPQVNLLLEDKYASVIPPMALGTEADSKDYASFPLSEGRRIREGESRVAVLGVDLAQQRGIGVGGIITLHGKRFTVVGLMDRTFVNLLDSSAFIPLADAQQLYYTSLPESFQQGVNPQDLVLQVNVYAQKGVNPDELAVKIGRDTEGILATGPTKMMDTVNGLIGLINAVVWSMAAIALIVSALSIINTMTMAVGERTREIGVKRALGASRWRVGRDVLLESAVMGALGGVGGLVLGALVATGLNAAMVSATGTSILLVTGRLLLGTLVFAIALGIMGGLWPARHASRLDPSAALAYE
jgi:putative ABC transport system permease protein